jgi:hypothetical protein
MKETSLIRVGRPKLMRTLNPGKNIPLKGLEVPPSVHTGNGKGTGEGAKEATKIAGP